ncbi:uncharacterized protein LOC112340770 [Selaginella moellendorffii]|uniref:uncharacterized protein LOC112340770 n=1 Tax=Selaginella moellendorffii TaxID=88036 RepID=UPI000D1C35CE|nr:uncharacterized protein LOC112340770 [Selaginella moellendorffii]|eukprot:XP_024515514.1 uncharacterized protein LOC112340770 [Selaginella moellendorffii]
MSKISRRKSPRFGSSKGKQNPFQNRGMDKFNEVYSELEKLRASIAAEEGVSTSDVWFTRGTSKGRDWVPVVVGRSRSSSIPSRGDSQPLTRLDKQNSSAESKTGDDVVSDQASVEEESHSVKDCSKQSWLSVKFEQLVYELQHGTRKALKAITLFIMIVAAIVDVLIAVVAGITSSFIARHLRPMWARYLPVNFPQQPNIDLSFARPVTMRSLPGSMSCVSAPTSPRQPHQFGSGGSFSNTSDFSRTTSASTPVSPVMSCSTFFSSDKPQEVGSPAHRHQPRNNPFQSEQQQGGSPAHRHQSEQQQGGSPAHRHQPRFQSEQRGGSPAHRHQTEQQQGGSPAHRHHSEQRSHHQSRLNHLQQQEELESCVGGNGGGAVQVMLIVVVILFGLTSTGMVAAIVFASMAWFVFPAARKVSSKPSNRTIFQHDELRKGLSV